MRWLRSPLPTRDGLRVRTVPSRPVSDASCSTLAVLAPSAIADPYVLRLPSEGRSGRQRLPPQSHRGGHLACCGRGVLERPIVRLRRGGCVASDAALRHRPRIAGGDRPLHHVEGRVDRSHGRPVRLATPARADDRQRGSDGGHFDRGRQDANVAGGPGAFFRIVGRRASAVAAAPCSDGSRGGCI